MIEPRDVTLELPEPYAPCWLYLRDGRKVIGVLLDSGLWWRAGQSVPDVVAWSYSVRRGAHVGAEIHQGERLRS